MPRTYNFEEWAPWEQNASPILLTLTLNAGMNELKDYFGEGLWTSVIVYKDEQAKWLFRPKELKMLGQKMIDFLFCPPYRVTFNTGYKTTEKSLLEKAEEIQFDDSLELQSNEQLLELFRDLEQCYYDWYKYGWFCEPVQFQGQDLLSAWIDRASKAEELTFDVDKAKEAAFTVDEESFTVEILRHLKECAEALGTALEDARLEREISEIEGEDEFAKKAAQITLSLIESNQDPRYKTLRKKIEEHSENFYWKENNYFSTKFVSKKDVLEELFSSEKFDIADPTSKLKTELEETVESKEQALKRKSELLEVLPPFYQNLVALMGSVGGSLIDKRKKTIMIANGAFDRILDIFAERTDTDLEDCRFLVPQELETFVTSPKEYEHRFEQRRDQFLVFQGDFSLLDVLFEDMDDLGGETEPRYKDFSMPEPFIAEGKQVDDIIDELDSRLNILSQTPAASMDSLQGVVTYSEASQPEIIGEASIIKNPKTETIQEGKILVAPSTTPDYMDSIRKAKAIITDWGGQTSHAAIISRELQIPCIIGTNYASQTLKNGEEVKLDFENGIVEKI